MIKPTELKPTVNPNEIKPLELSNEIISGSEESMLIYFNKINEIINVLNKLTDMISGAMSKRGY